MSKCKVSQGMMASVTSQVHPTPHAHTDFKLCDVLIDVNVNILIGLSGIEQYQKAKQLDGVVNTTIKRFCQNCLYFFFAI